jgi:hypothetical protein
MIQIINRFFTTVNNIDESMIFLKENKDYILEPYTSIQTRKILYTLVIYKFGNEFDCPDKLKKLARNVILYTLESSKYPKDILHKEILIYIREFDSWKKNDLENLLLEVAGSYVNLDEMKNNIIRKNTKTEIDAEWIEKINNLMDKLMSYGNKLNPKHFKDILDKLKINIHDKKEKLAKDFVDDIYWKNFLDLIKENNYDLLYNNFEEIKNILNEIKPDNVHQEVLDLDYLKQLIQNNIFTPDFLINYINFICDKLLKYGIPAYDHIIKETRIKLINNITTNGITPDILTNTFRFIMNMLQQLIEIIRIYRKHIHK